VSEGQNYTYREIAWQQCDDAHQLVIGVLTEMTALQLFSASRTPNRAAIA
jgi:hypothetical protein